MSPWWCGGGIEGSDTPTAQVGRAGFHSLYTPLLLPSPRLVEGYGLTETTAVATLVHINDPTNYHVGMPSTGGELKLVDVPDMNYSSSVMHASNPHAATLNRSPCCAAYLKSTRLGILLGADGATVRRGVRSRPPRLQGLLQDGRQDCGSHRCGLLVPHR